MPIQGARNTAKMKEAALCVVEGGQRVLPEPYYNIESVVVPYYNLDHRIYFIGLGQTSLWYQSNPLIKISISWFTFKGF